MLSRIQLLLALFLVISGFSQVYASTVFFVNIHWDGVPRDLEIESITVNVFDTEGNFVEAGEAVFSHYDGDASVYKATWIVNTNGYRFGTDIVSELLWDPPNPALWGIIIHGDNNFANIEEGED